MYFIFEYTLYVCHVFLLNTHIFKWHTGSGDIKILFFCLHKFPHAVTEVRACGTESPAIVGKARYAFDQLTNHKKFCLISDQDSELAGSVILLIVNNKEGRKEIFYLTTHSTHCIYDYMASDIW